MNRELQQQVHVAMALPKGDRQRWLIEKLVELGVSLVVPLRTQRSVVHPDERSLRRLQRTVVEASKQCGRNRLMEIGTLTEFSDFVRSAPSNASRWIADPSGESRSLTPTSGRDTFVAVGPEGGFTETELACAKSANWQTISLGNRILRIETACLVIATLASHCSPDEFEAGTHEAPR